MRSAILLSVVASIVCSPSIAEAFASGGRGRLRSLFSSLHAVETTAQTESTSASGGVCISVLATPPSWDELSAALQQQNDASTESSSSPKQKPLVTLYRDTNGWCPFCERVWLILRAKGIPYDEQLISLQNKPDWYKALVPTTLVPAVLFHGDEATNERRIVWESSDIFSALEEAFPDTPKMVHDTSEYKAALQLNEDLTMAGFGFVYAGRNDTLTEDDKLERKNKFLAELDRLNTALDKRQQQQQAENGGLSFMLGAFSAVDAIMIPTLERWRVQLPITNGVDIQEGRPALTKWFEAMDSFEPYSSRVAGDEYSWTATNSMFLRYFGGGEDKPEVAEAIARADDAAERLTALFADKAVTEDVGDKKYSKEAAAKLVSNHEAVVKDCTRGDPQSQQHIKRGTNSDAADAMLRYVTSCLLSSDDTIQQAKEATLLDLDEAESDGFAKDAATAARTIASRLCVPRDMSAPAASMLRAVLAIIADRLEE